MCGPGISEPYKTIFGGVLYTGTFEGKQYNNQPLPANAVPGCDGATLGAISGTTGEPVVGQPAGATFLGEKGLVVQPLNYNSAEDQTAHRNTDAGGFQTKVDYKFYGFTLTSITAYRQMNRFFHGPLGNGYYTSGYLNNWYAADQGSEEIRLASPASEKLNYVIGAIAYDRDTRMKSLSTTYGYGQSYDEYPNTPYGANVLISTAGGLQRITDINKSYGVFGDGSYHVTSQLVLVGGIRMTHDEVYAGINVIPTNGFDGIYDATIGSALYNGHNAAAILPPRSLGIQKNGYTWRVGPQYFFTPDIMVYGTWAHGYKGPVVDTSVGTLDAIKPEQSELLEAGIKSSWLDHTLTVNFTLFRQMYTDYQVNVLNQSVIPNVFQLGNAGGMLAQGGELEVNWRPIRDLHQLHHLLLERQ
jgi:iron complex outermembrane receptor protein